MILPVEQTNKPSQNLSGLLTSGQNFPVVPLRDSGLLTV